jgi:tetratricopeptide (TPR) repeat protein
MASVCLSDQGDCFTDLGRLDEAAGAYEESIQQAEQLKDNRQLAVAKFQLGTVRMFQKRYEEALTAYEEAREQFANLGEPGSVVCSRRTRSISCSVLPRSPPQLTWVAKPFSTS